MGRELFRKVGSVLINVMHGLYFSSLKILGIQMGVGNTPGVCRKGVRKIELMPYWGLEELEDFVSLFLYSYSP